MKKTKQFRISSLGWLLSLAGWLAAGIASHATNSTFTFILEEPCKTSAGVFAPNGTLIRTLWSKVRYPAGTNSAVWDGLDDCSNVVAAGLYQIKVLQHNTEYVWDGAIGNTSDAVSGPTVHNGFYPMCDMTIAGTNGYYVSGYNEGGYDFRGFWTTDPQQVVVRWSPDNAPANTSDRNWNWTATDGNWVYFGCSAASNPNNLTNNNYPGFIVASQVGLSNPAFSAYFSQGGPIVNGEVTNVYPNGIYVGTQPGLSGLAVQQNGNLLAAAVAPDNRVYLLDKRSGATLTSFGVPSPGRMSFSPDGSLWVVSGTSVIAYDNLSVNPAAVVTIPNFSEPLAVAVNPTNASLILVADGGSSQQVKAFDNAGNPLWTYGLAGGYQTNGITVQTNKFWFNNGETNDTFLCFAPDGSFWVGDGGNFRSIHFSAACNYLEQIMYQPHSYIACVDQNNPSRVFNQFLEFKVDYTKPLPQAWTLVNNWKVGVDPVHVSWDAGIYEVTTFTNGRTYALIDNNTAFPTFSELCELATNQLRLTGIAPAYDSSTCWISLGPDGSARRATPGSASWYETTLNGFDASNNPTWNPATLIASAPEGDTDPFPRFKGIGNLRTSISSNNILISLDQSLSNNFHLGGIRVGSTNWLWRASPAVAFMDGLGTYEISNGVTYGGDTVQAIDRNVIYGYHGEFFRGSGQAGQIMHFYDDGLFVGQFGESDIGHNAYEGALPGFAGNGFSPSLIKTTNSDYYLWINDEAGHGPQRWHFVNARNIREQSGTGLLGTSITLTNPPCDFPTAVTGKNGNHSVELSWLPVAGATAYNIRYSLMNGGPYSVLAATTPRLDYVIGGLTNGLTYYFVVTAVQSVGEGTTSEQVAVTPFDTTQTVLCAGQMSEDGLLTPVVEVDSNAPAAGQPGWVGVEHLTGLLNPRELDDYGYGNLQNESLGTQGYVIIDDEGPATSLPNLPASFSLAYGSGWTDLGNLERQYDVNGFVAMNHGMLADSLRTLDIGVSDTNYHFLTVISPAEFNSSRKFTLGITSTNGSSAQYSVNEYYGYSHVFQFLFQGDVTLWADGSNGSEAIIQAIFLDNAPVTYAPPSIQTNAIADITNGLVLHYPLNADGSDVWSGNNLTLVGSPFFSNGAIYWDGVAATLGYTSPQTWPQTGLTISAWIDMADPAANYSVAACHGNYTGSTDQAYFQFYTAAGKLNARIIQDADVNYIGRTTLASLSAGWHFAAFTWSGGTNNNSIVIYLDGTIIDNSDNGAGTFSAAYSGSDLPLALGAQFSGGPDFTQPFFGGENGVRMYDRALSGGEIGTLYVNGLEGATATYPGINNIGLSGTDLTLNVSSGLAGMTYSVLMSTNLAQPFNQWTLIAANIPGTNGNFSVTITNAVDPDSPQRFYMLRTP